MTPWRCSTLLLLLACGRTSAPVDAGVDAGLDAGPGVSVATFNVRRFFDTVCDTGQCGPGDYEAVVSEEAFTKRAAQLATTVDGFGVDLVALEELETQAVIDAVLARTGPMRFAVLGETGAPASVDVAIFSRVPFEQVVHHRDALTRPDGTPTVFSRELLEVHVTLEGRPVIFFAAHFKSKSNDDPGRRLAEAQTTRRILDEVQAANPDALVLLGGDLNDEPGSPPLDALTADGGLVRAAAVLPEAAQATYVFDGQGQAIDHLLQEPTDVATLRADAVHVWRGSGTHGFAGSDHFALSAAWGFTP